MGIGKAIATRLAEAGASDASEYIIGETIVVDGGALII